MRLSVLVLRQPPEVAGAHPRRLRSDRRRRGGAPGVREAGYGSRPRQRSDVNAAPPSSSRPAAANPGADLALLLLGADPRAERLVDLVERVGVLGRERAAAGDPGDLGQRLRVGRDRQDLAAEPRRRRRRCRARRCRSGRSRREPPARPRPGRARSWTRRRRAARSRPAGCSSRACRARSARCRARRRWRCRPRRAAPRACWRPARGPGSGGARCAGRRRTRPGRSAACPGRGRGSRLAAAFAAVRRSGATSVAFIEPDVSVTSITDAFSTGTAMVASGRASAVIRPASARHSSAGGIARRARPVRPATAASVAVAGKRTTYFAGRRRASTSASSAAGMAARPSRNSGAWKLIAGSGRGRAASRRPWSARRAARGRGAGAT